MDYKTEYGPLHGRELTTRESVPGFFYALPLQAHMREGFFVSGKSGTGIPMQAVGIYRKELFIKGCRYAL